MENDYYEANHPDLSTLAVDLCHLCGNRVKQGETTNPDHIFPNKFFAMDSPKRPKLLVHPSCNNAKSKNDEWFIREMQLMCSLHPNAEAEVIKLPQKAHQEKLNAFIIGKSKEVRNYKRAVSLLDNNVWGLQLKHQGKTIYSFNMGKANNDRLRDYTKVLCRGLFIRNISGARPSMPTLMWLQYANLTLKNEEYRLDPVKHLINFAGKNGSLFYQQWGDRISYFGSPVVESKDKGFLYVQFYRQVGVLAKFD